MRRQHLLSIALELDRALARHRCEVGEAPGPPRRNLRERGVVEDDVGGHLVLPRAFEAPLLQEREARVVGVGLLCSRRAALDFELGEEAARFPGPRDEQVPLRARQPDVEEPPLLGDLGRGLGELRRQLLFLHTRHENRLELEAFSAVQRQKMHAAARFAAVAEAALELRDERRPVEPRELLGESDEPREVVLTDELALSELVGRLLEPTVLFGEATYLRRRVELSQDIPRTLAREE